MKQYVLCSSNKNELKLNKHGILLQEACWMISNITAGTEDQIDRVICSNIIPSLRNLLEKAPFEVRKEVAWAITNATTGGNNVQIRYLVHTGLIPPIVSLLELNNPRILLVAMEGLHNILKCGEDIKNAKNSDTNEFAIRVKAAGGFDKVEYILLYFILSLLERNRDVCRVIDCLLRLLKIL